MSHAEKCPVCDGTGIIKWYNRNFSPFGFESTSGQSFIEKTCHGCQGKGWVTVTDTNDIFKYDYNKRSYLGENTTYENG